MASDDPHSCHLPIPPIPSLQRWQTQHRKSAQWVLGHFAVIRCLLPSVISPRASPESYLSYFAVSVNYELFQLQLDKIVLAHLHEQSPTSGYSVECWLSGEPCWDARVHTGCGSWELNSMIPCMWCGAWLSSFWMLYHALEERHFCIGLSACASLVGWGGLKWEILGAANFRQPVSCGAARALPCRSDTMALTSL